LEEKRVFDCIWKSKAPLKVVVFSWKLLHDRIPSRSNLARRNCLPPEVSMLCVLCGSSEKSSNHLFLHCNFTARVWANVMRWFGFYFITPPNLFVHWECWSIQGGTKKIRKGLWFILHAIIWAFWQARNHIIFRNETKQVDELVTEIIVLS